MLPLSYSIRNLFRSPGRLAQIVLGSALVSLLLMAAAAINAGMEGVLGATGSPRNVILLGAGSEESVERSEIAPSAPGIAAAAIRAADQPLGQPAVSGEVNFMNYVETPGGEKGQITLRGITPAALAVHTEVRVTAGAFPAPGQLMVGRLAHYKLGFPEAALALGKTLRIAGADLVIAGRFDAPGTVLESEIWMDQGDLLTLTQRDTLSAIVVRLGEGGEFDDVDLFAKQRLDLELAALSESDYYDRLASFYAPVRYLTWISAALIAAGAIFGGLNTLYAAFASRIREFGALQAIGYSRTALLVSLVQESLFAALAGALLAGALALLLVDGVTVPFSIGTFTMALTPGILALGIGGGVALGIFGALPPAWACLRPPITTALRA
ncbi:MAG: FtsX-like permease family protein [Verrucomicrobiales bacterium]